METLQDIRDFFFAAVQDTEAGEMYFTTEQTDLWVEAALAEMGQYAQYADSYVDNVSATGVSSYIPGSTNSTLGVWRVELDKEALRPVTKAQLLKNDRNAQTKTGRPRFYYLDNESTDPDVTRVGLYPAPDSTAYTIRTYYYEKPYLFDSSLDDPEAIDIYVPKWAIYGVMWYVLSEAYLAETMRQNLDTSAFYRMLYEGILDRLKLRTNDRLGPKEWAVGQTPTPGINDFWHNLPDTIPEP